MVPLLSEENFIEYAMQNYQTPSQSSVEEFHEDLKRIQYIKTLISKYVRDHEKLKERLILNHIIILQNVFGVKASVVLLFLKLPKDLWPQLKTFLMFLNYMPENVEELSIISSDVSIDEFLFERLKDL
jgi:hypothetical protein